LINLNIILSSVGVLVGLFAMQKLIGHRWAAFAACLPLTSGPLIVAATMKFGVPVAQQILVGCVIATGAASVAIYAFGRLRHQPVTLALTIALLVFSVVVFAQQKLSNIAELCAAIAIVLVFVTALISGSQPQAPARIITRSNRGNIAVPCLILAMCLASISFLPPQWSGVLAASPLIALSFLISLRRAGNSAETVSSAVVAANQGLITKLVLFCTADVLLETMQSWALAYVITIVITVTFLLLSISTKKLFDFRDLKIDL
jgi:hypothetical protein